MTEDKKDIKPYYNFSLFCMRKSVDSMNYLGKVLETADKKDIDSIVTINSRSLRNIDDLLFTNNDISTLKIKIFNSDHQRITIDYLYSLSGTLQRYASMSENLDSMYDNPKFISYLKEDCFFASGWFSFGKLWFSKPVLVFSKDFVEELREKSLFMRSVIDGENGGLESFTYFPQSDSDGFPLTAYNVINKDLGLLMLKELEKMAVDVSKKYPTEYSILRKYLEITQTKDAVLIAQYP